MSELTRRDSAYQDMTRQLHVQRTISHTLFEKLALEQRPVNSPVRAVQEPACRQEEGS